MSEHEPIDAGGSRDPGSADPVDPDPVDPGPVDPGPVDPDPVDSGPVDLDRIESDLRDVESALARLADGTYFAGTNSTGTDGRENGTDS